MSSSDTVIMQFIADIQKRMTQLNHQWSNNQLYVPTPTEVRSVTNQLVELARTDAIKDGGKGSVETGGIRVDYTLEPLSLTIMYTGV